MASESDSFSRLSLEDRLEILELELIDSVIGGKAAELLREQGFRTLGDLVLATDSELLKIKGIGNGKLQKLKDILDVFGLRLRDETEDPLLYAVNLYGGVENVPSKLMFRWVTGLDEASFTYLRMQETLKWLSLRGRLEYLSWRHATFPARERFAEPQAELMAQGLAYAGLSFSGEE